MYICTQKTSGTRSVLTVCMWGARVKMCVDIEARGVDSSSCLWSGPYQHILHILFDYRNNGGMPTD